MADLFMTGRIVDLIVGLMVLEAIAVLVYERKTGRGVSPRALLSNLLSGLFLLLALRSALVDAAWSWTAVFLVAALLGHLTDIGYRWRR